MRTKRKLLISMLAIVFVLLAVVATVAIAFALTQQTITTTLNIGYVVEDIDGTASATYTIGGVTERLTAMKGDNVIGDTLVFHAGDTEDAGNLMFPEGQIPLSAQNDNIVIQYTYSNTGAKHYIASMSFDSELVADNMKVEYSIDGVTYSENRYAVVVPAHSTNKSYWIKISIDNKAKSASFTGDFRWLLSGCDEQEDSYLSLTSLEFTGSAGSYSASVASEGEYAGSLVFPSAVNGDPVTTIAQASSLTAEQKNQVTSVYIPDSVTTIGDRAFQSYTNLQTVTFKQNETGSTGVQSGTGLKIISKYAFAFCSDLSNIIIPKTVTTLGSQAFWKAGFSEIVIPDGVTSIPTQTFMGCENLSKVVFPNNLKSIGVNAFSSCNKLQNIDFPESLTTIGALVFTSPLITEITIPKNVTTISYNAFYGCKNVKVINIEAISCASSSSDPYNGFPFSGVGENVSECIVNVSANVKKLGSNLFRGAQGITKVNIQGEGLTTIGYVCFFNCQNLSAINLPNSVTTIEGEVFSGCKKLTEISIPTSLTSLSNYLFKNTGIVSITIPQNITKIGKNVFSGCTALTSLILEDKAGWWYTTDEAATSGTSVTITTNEEALTLFKETHVSNYWRKT